jgi:CD2 antigen cytoplasmic tail-binding protein 2
LQDSSVIGSMERVANDGDIFWQDNENFDDDGIQIEPFNLNKEREEGYFDADGNFVEYVNDNEIKVNYLTYVHSNCRIEHVY